MRQIGCVFATLAFIILCKWKFSFLNSSSLIAIGVQSLHRLFIYEDVFENHSGVLAFEGEWTRDLSFPTMEKSSGTSQINVCVWGGHVHRVEFCNAPLKFTPVKWADCRYSLDIIRLGQFIWGLSWGMLYVKVLFDRRTFRLTKWQIS